MSDGSVPGEIVPDEHLIVDSDDIAQCDIRITSTDDGRGAAIYGICPPFYAPAVYRKGESTYRVTRAGCPSATVDVSRRTCDDPHCSDNDWCVHLRAAQLYHTRGITDD